MSYGEEFRKFTSCLRGNDTHLGTLAELQIMAHRIPSPMSPLFCIFHCKVCEDGPKEDSTNCEPPSTAVQKFLKVGQVRVYHEKRGRKLNLTPPAVHMIVCVAERPYRCGRPLRIGQPSFREG